MIRRVKYHEIDFEKYELCIENSVQRKYAATKNFLDIVAGKNWEIIVLDDYEAVMPITFVVKYGIRFVLNPKLCQQLGIYSREDSVEINDLFFKFFQKKYRIFYYPFNDCNVFSEQLPRRNNFIIFPDEYENVYQKYSPKRKRKIRQEPEIKENSKIIRQLGFDKVKNFIIENMLGAKANSNDIHDFIALFKAFFDSGKLDFMGYYYHDELINLLAVYHDEKTNVLLGTINDHQFMKISGASVLFDEYLKETIAQKAFDFEGGDIPNIEEFFRGFRPELKTYPYIQNSKKSLIFQFFKSIFV